MKMGDGESARVPLDDLRVDPMFDLLEETGFPVIYHVGSAVYLPRDAGFRRIKRVFLPASLGTILPGTKTCRRMQAYA